MSRKRKYSSSLDESDTNSDEDSSEDSDIDFGSSSESSKKEMSQDTSWTGYLSKVLYQVLNKKEQISKSSVEFSSLLTSDSFKDELYFLFRNTLSFFLGEFCL